jgi:hypothetical protein
MSPPCERKSGVQGAACVGAREAPTVCRRVDASAGAPHARAQAARRFTWRARARFKIPPVAARVPPAGGRAATLAGPHRRWPSAAIGRYRAPNEGWEGGANRF